MLDLALEHGLVLGVEVRGDDDELRHSIRQPGQVRTDSRHRLLAAHHEPHHEVAARRDCHDQVLQLAAAGRNVIGLEPHARDGLDECREDGENTRVDDAAVAQVDAATLTVENAERGLLDRAADDHLGLGAKAAVVARDGRQPLRASGEGFEQRTHAVLFGGELFGVRLTHERARPAEAGVEVVALHGALTLGPTAGTTVGAGVATTARNDRRSMLQRGAN